MFRLISWVLGVFLGAALLIPVTVNAAFIDRGDAVYDDATGLTWDKVPDNGVFDWAGAKSYADGLTLAGKNDWRLPELSELQTLYAHIDALGGCPGGDCKGDQSPFSDIQFIYWSATELDAFNARVLGFSDGLDNAVFKTLEVLYAWAVRAGDVGDTGGRVPEPATLALLGLGLAGLGWSRRRK